MASNNSSARPKARKAVHYGPSKCKQTAEKISNQCNDSRDKTLLHKDSKKNQGTSQLHVTSANLKSGINSTLKCTIQREFTSTPVADATCIPSYDASSITNSSFHFSGIKDKERVVAASILDYSKRNLALKSKTRCDPSSVGLVTSTKKGNKKFETYNQEIAEEEIDISYALYLQAAFLESRAKKSLETRINAALEKLHEVWHVTQIYMQKDAELQKNLHFFSCIIQKHNHLQKQEQMLKSTLQIITMLENQYEAIARAVDAVRHKLHIKDVLLPNAGDEIEIIQLLKKVNDIINNFLKDMPNLDEFNLSVCNLNNFVTDGELITEEIKSCSDQLSEAKDLVLSEASFLLGCELCNTLTANT